MDKGSVIDIIEILADNRPELEFLLTYRSGWRLKVTDTIVGGTVYELDMDGAPFELLVKYLVTADFDANLKAAYQFVGNLEAK